MITGIQEEQVSGLCSFFLHQSFPAAIPTIKVTGPATLTVNETSPVSFQCTAKGRPPPTVSWFNGSALVADPGRVNISNSADTQPDISGLYAVVSTVNISSTMSGDSSTFKCVASTLKAVLPKSTTATVILLVQGERQRHSSGSVKHHYRQ